MIARISTLDPPHPGRAGGCSGKSVAHHRQPPFSPSIETNAFRGAWHPSRNRLDGVAWEGNVGVARLMQRTGDENNVTYTNTHTHTHTHSIAYIP